MKTFTLHSFFVYILCEGATDKTKRLHLYKVLSPRVYQGSSGKTASLPTFFSQTHLVTPIQTLMVFCCVFFTMVLLPHSFSVLLYIKVKQSYLECHPSLLLSGFYSLLLCLPEHLPEATWSLAAEETSYNNISMKVYWHHPTSPCQHRWRPSA